MYSVHNLPHSPTEDQTTRKSDQIDHIIANRIKARRRQIGMSQRELADALGLSYQQIQKYESGANRISAGRLFMISCCINISVPDLFKALPCEGIDKFLPQNPEKELDTLKDPTLKRAIRGLLGAIIESQNTPPAS